MSQFTKEQVKEELTGQQTEEGFMSDEIFSCSLVEEEEFFSQQYSEDESGQVGDSRQLINNPILDHSRILSVYLPVLEMVNPNYLMGLPEDVVNAIWEPNCSDDLLDMEGLPMPYGSKGMVTGSLSTLNYLIRRGICIKTNIQQKFVCSP